VFAVRIHGRGGQGVVTAAELLSQAAFQEGRHAQAFPSFGSERTGAPVVSFCRVSDREIRTREPILEPDALVVQDPTLLHQVDVFGGLSKDGYVLINTVFDFEELGLQEWSAGFRRERLLTVPASDISRDYEPYARANTALLGGLASLTGVVSIGSIERAIAERFGGAVGVGNVEAARACHDFVSAELLELAHA